MRRSLKCASVSLLALVLALLLRRDREALMDGTNDVLYDRKGVRNMLPHRWWWLLLDHVRMIDDIMTGVFVPKRWHYYGHFPGNRIVPQTQLIEFAVQFAALAIAHQRGCKASEVRLLRPTPTQITKEIRPGDIVFATVKGAPQIKERNGQICVKGMIALTCDGEEVMVVEAFGFIIPG